MAELIDTAKDIEKVILIGVCTSENDDTEESLDELEELVKTAGAVTLEKVIQNRDSVHPGTYIGTGKIEEVRELAEEIGATGVVCDDELSPAQLRNLESELRMKVMDRTMVILDIFAKRAVTSEGKIQVEAAQLKYSLARLVGLRSSRPSCTILSFISLLSSSSFFSPGPLVPIEPAIFPPTRERELLRPTSLARLYLSCAAST